MRARRLCPCLGIVLAAVLLPSAELRAQLRSVVVASGLTAPLAFVQDPSDPTVQFIVEQGGRIRVLRNGTLVTSSFLDISASITSGGERGLLGLAFPVDYAASGRFYVNFTDLNGDTVVARFRRSAGNPLVADAASRFDLLWSTGERVIRQPFANHNGGNLAFGPDGFLYIGMGDGGSGNDPGNRAQDPTTLLGKMLRIDVNVPDSDTTGFRVPADNPFVSGAPVAALPEIWDFGLRNPWRYSFDDVARGGTGALVIGDVGQNMWEEIDYEPRGRGGRNYGWRYMEGLHLNVTTLPPAYLPLTDPIAEYDHTVGVAVIGGIVYRGRALGSLFNGRYFYGDETGRVWSIGLALDPGTGEATANSPIEHTNELGGVAVTGAVVSFGTDASGELYLVNLSGGTVLRIIPAWPTDFNGDGKPDLLWRNTATGEIKTWFMDGAALGSQASLPTVTGTQWHIVATGDFNGDGKPDLVWRNDTTGQNVVWFLDGTTLVVQGALPTVADPAWQIVGAADFNGDGKPDLIWRNTSTGQNVVWFLDGVTFVSQAALPSVPDGHWQIAAAADFNGDAKPDLVWRNTTTGQDAVWLLDGVTFVSQAALPTVADGHWQIAAAADFNADGQVDIVWRNSATGQNVVWYMAGVTFVSQALLPSEPNVRWRPAGAPVAPPAVLADLNADGRPDVLWRNVSTGQNVVWYMNGTAVQTQATLPTVADVSWQVVATADLDGDGQNDLVWRSAATGMNTVWFTNGATVVSQVSLPTVSDTNWQIVAAGDFNGDGQPDIVWRNATTGMNAVWLMNGATLGSQALLPTVSDPNWQIVAAADLNGDGRPDLVWRNATTGQDVVWFLSGTTFQSQAQLPAVPDPSWQVAMAGDFSGDGKPDLVWRNQVTGADVVWYLDGVTFAGQASLPSVPDANWTIMPARR
jgi:glucose/arabinose dehydrogenase